ncbi:MAG: lysophospholipid acyltransferase family protein [Proteobacteria bacterium]|nr:lysophospholipid acyltransferase family protein [Pseudomonadota bacterium]
MDERSEKDVRRPLPAPLGLIPESWPLPTSLRRLIGWASGISALEQVAGRLDFDADAGAFARQTLDELGVSFSLSPAELQQVPAAGGVIIVANHPFGGIDGLIAITALCTRRPDLKLLANGMLARLQPLHDMVLPIDTLGGDARGNSHSVREALRHVAAGGALFTFPAGEVAHLRWGRPGIVDPPWTRAASRLLRLAGAPVVPMYFDGRNGALFQALGLLHPLLRTLLLPRELLNKSGRNVQVRIGAPVSVRRIRKLDEPGAIAAHLRASIRLLARSQPVAPNTAAADAVAPVPAQAGMPAPRAATAQAEGVPLADPIDPAQMAQELAALPPNQRLLVSGSMEIYCASAAQIPWTLQEIGRLRERTFRAVGEGTGRAADLDLFDDYYEHLFIWQAERREVVGAYRLGRSDTIRKRFGARGLYLTSLFEFREPFFKLLGPALELGRSFVRPEYQRSYAPLLLLWKGISEYIGRYPAYPRLIGAASVSNNYDPLSRALLVEALRAWRSEPLLGALVNPRRPFKARYSLRSLFGEAGLEADMDALGSLIEDREVDGKGVPVLLRHYLKLGARTIGFNIDTEFGNALDCLIVLDLRRVPLATLQKYMSDESLRSFRSYWRLRDEEIEATPARG